MPKNNSNSLNDKEQVFLSVIKISAIYRINHNAGFGKGFLSNKGTKDIKSDIEQSIIKFKKNNNIGSLSDTLNNDLEIAQSIGDNIGLTIINEIGNNRINKYSPFTTFVNMCPEIVRRTCFFGLAYMDILTKGFVDYLLPDLIGRLTNGYNESLFELPANLVKSSLDRIVNNSIKLNNDKCHNATQKTVAAEPIKNVERSFTPDVAFSKANIVKGATSIQNLNSDGLNSAVERVKAATNKLLDASRAL